MSVVPQIERQLHEAAKRRAQTPVARVLTLARRLPSMLVARPPIIALAVLLAIGGIALAAGGVIRFGAPAERPEGFVRGRFANPLSGGALVKGAVRPLPIATADPAGGPPWGMRVLSTKYGEGCVQVGRLLDGRLGAIGQDHAFSDDGLFHEFPVQSTFVPHTCTVLDGNDRIFLNATVGDLPASAWIGASGGCVPSTATHAERFSEDGKPRALCPLADERNLFYGLLGPDAKSITYVLGGHTRTQPTVGAEGAYLIVTTATPTQLSFNLGTQDIVPVDGPITELHYRDGSTCHLTARSWIGGREACTPQLSVPVGWVAPKAPVPSAAAVATPLRVQLVRSHRGSYEIVVSFRSRVAVTNARSSYTLQWHESEMPPQVNGYSPTHAPLAVGQTVTRRIGWIGPTLRPGVTTGMVVFKDATGPGQLEEGPGTIELVVGRFAVRVP
jgi:hypothetical protein